MLAGDDQVKRREAVVERLLHAICGEDELPWFVSDDATVFDVCTLSEEDLLARLAAAFGVATPTSDLRLPIWRLAEKLSGSGARS